MSKSWIHSAQVAGLVCCLAGCGGGGGDGSPEAGAPAAGAGPGAPASWQVGGTAQGISGAGLMLLNNGSERLAVPANGSFAFATALASGATFSVSIAAQPSGQLCSVINGSGSVADADVTAVGVSCVTAAAGAGAEYGSGPDPIPAISANPGSGDLIRAALDAGTLAPEQALIYAMYAEYKDSRLPAQYLGDDTGVIEGTAHEKVLDHIATVGLANVSQATLDALKPFFIPAHQEGSYERASVGAHDKRAARATAPKGTKAGWTAVAGTNVVVWYETSRAASDGANAAMLVAEFDNRIWPMLTGLMGRTPKSDLGSKFFTETDGRLDVTLTQLSDNKEGVTTPTDWVAKDTSVHIALSRDLSPQGLQAQAAHEFMHAIQFSIDVKAHNMPSYATIKEATASWASHYVYPLNGWESKYAQSYLKGGQFGYSYDSPRNKNDKSNLAFRYGAYVLPLFLQTRFGAGIVKDIWDRTVSESFELDAISKAIAVNGSTFEDEWKKFIAFCWNQETINDATRLYQAAKIPFTTAPDDPANDIEKDDVVSLTNGFAQVEHDIDLPRASMAFYRVRFSGASSRSVTFVNGINFGLDTFDDSGVGNALRFTGLQPAQRDGVSMQLYLKVNGAWQSAPVDVTNVPWISICRDTPAGWVEEVVFMYGNGEVDRGDPHYVVLNVPGANGPGLIATDIGCKDWTARLDMTRPVDAGTGVETFKLRNVTLTNALSTAAPQPGGPHPPYGLKPGEQVQPGFGFIYKVTGGTAEWTYNQHIGGSTTCDYAGGKTYSVTGGPAVGAIPVLTLSNYTPPGNAARGLITVGLAINALADFISLSADWRCVDGDGKVTTGTDAGIAASMDMFAHELSAVRVSAGGLSISGTGVQTSAGEGGDTKVTGTWTLTAVP
jgi:hypothetical protein